MAKWQRSGREPGKDYSNVGYEPAGGIVRDDPKIGVIILTGAPDFAKSPRRP